MSQRFQVDGVPVAACEGVFAHAFDMDPADAEEVVYDQTYVLVVVATTLPPGFRTDKNGDLIRRNRFEVSAAKVAKAGLGDELAEMFDLDIQQRLPFTPPPAIVSGVNPSGAGSGSQSPVQPPRTVPVASGASVAASIPVGVPVGQVDPSEDEALRRFLDGE